MIPSPGRRSAPSTGPAPSPRPHAAEPAGVPRRAADEHAAHAAFLADRGGAPAPRRASSPDARTIVSPADAGIGRWGAVCAGGRLGWRAVGDARARRGDRARDHCRRVTSRPRRARTRPSIIAAGERRCAVVHAQRRRPDRADHRRRRATRVRAPRGQRAVRHRRRPGRRAVVHGDGHRPGRADHARGEIEEFPLAAGAMPSMITSGPDGALWFTLNQGTRSGGSTTAGA